MIWVFAAVRWLHEGALMGLFGACLLSCLLRTRLPQLPLGYYGRLKLGVAVLALASGLAWFVLAAAQMAGDLAAMLDPAVLEAAAIQTVFGQVFLARLVLLVLLCAAAAWRDDAAALLAAGGLAGISVTSHAAAASPAHFTAIGITADTLHLWTGGFWIGGLALLAVLFAAATQRQMLAQAIGIFAGWAMVAVAVLVLTGMLNAANVLLGGEGHDTAFYLGVLGIKLVLVAAMLGLALTNHFHLLPRLSQDAAARRLGRNILWELGLGLGVILLAGLLGLLQPIA